jgi:hypothetical protein
LASIPLSQISKISVSCLSDNYVCIHTQNPTLNDEFIYSKKKTEIIQILLQNKKSNNVGPEVNIFSGALTYHRSNQIYTGVFLESDTTITDNSWNGTFEVIGPHAFKISVSKHLISSGSIFECMEVFIDGIEKPIVVCCSDMSTNSHQPAIVPCVKLPEDSDRTFYSVLYYYAIQDMIGYHVEQQFGSLVYLSAIDDCPKSDKKNSTRLKKQQIPAPRFLESVKRMVTRVLDTLGNEVAIFHLDLQF